MYEELIKDLRENHDKYFARDMETADAIEELSMKLHGDEAAIAWMKREIERMVVADKPRWIPVTERLPEIGTRCVTVSKDGDYGLALYSDMGWMFPYYMGKTEYWMPLPEPPKEES